MVFPCKLILDQLSDFLDLVYADLPWLLLINLKFFQFDPSTKTIFLGSLNFHCLPEEKELWGHIDGLTPTHTDPIKLAQWETHNA